MLGAVFANVLLIFSTLAESRVFKPRITDSYYGDCLDPDNTNADTVYSIAHSSRELR